ncbi:MAG TPA: DUF6600 domain-containing protein [Polyangiaceae bacterium]
MAIRAAKLTGLILSALVAVTGAASAVEQDDSWFDPPPKAKSSETTSSPPAAQGAAKPAARPVEAAGQDESNPRVLKKFRAHLRRYGSWARHEQLGLVWIPNRAVIGDSFTPYLSSGHWEVAGADRWVWVSDYPFGWIVFHYGRWAWTEDLGWVWIPGTVYSDAWVAWDFYPRSVYVGWWPTPPPFIWIEGRLVWVGYYRDYYPRYIYVRRADFYSRDLRGYAFTPSGSYQVPRFAASPTVSYPSASGAAAPTQQSSAPPPLYRSPADPVRTISRPPPQTTAGPSPQSAGSVRSGVVTRSATSRRSISTMAVSRKAASGISVRRTRR